MEFKHTPAPWVCMNGTDVFTDLNSVNANGIKSDKTDGWQIADCSVGKTCVDGEYVELSANEQIANAHLIAAAPELLEALQKLLKYHDDFYGIEKDEDPEHPLSVANLAIAKALGQQ
ncbi:hypothetical protein ACI6PX_06215 [Proteus sp. NGCRVN-01]|uniref:hypothetical protein n=1 Tax=Proteus sp. NGCRVN-01 TaxID=3380534 RepID=UPI0038727208